MHVCMCIYVYAACRYMYIDMYVYVSVYIHVHGSVAWELVDLCVVNSLKNFGVET